MNNFVRTSYRCLSCRYVSSFSTGVVFGEFQPHQPPLYRPLPGVKLPPFPDNVYLGRTLITILPSGLRVASETSFTPAASIGLYIDCGSIYETPASSGVTHLLKHIAFKSTINRTHLNIAQEVDAIGGNVTASASREHMSYSYVALKNFVPQMLELIIDCVRNPAFLDSEVSEEIQNVCAEISEYSRNPQHLLLEAIHSTGYSGPYANGLVASKSAVGGLDSTVLKEFVSENYTAPRIVLAASGVDHHKLLEYAEPLLYDLPYVPRPSVPKPIYTGGDFRSQDDSGITHFALAFELPGGWVNEKDAIILTVLQALMGGGSLLAGGLGNRMNSGSSYSVLSKHSQVQSFSAFSSIYNHTGLFGICSTTGSGFATTAIDIAVKELIAISSPGAVGQLNLEHAKKAAKSAILINSESSMLASEDIGKQVLRYGERKRPVEHLLKVVDEIEAQDIAQTVQMLLSSPLTMASYGDVRDLQSYDALSSRFHS